ncbi:hypothetical protein RHGRI_024114 [Rhododendron griersonianum]|uniref:Uncharacterized protein n=1 Tax=Rhododendron griersonianum TaxID=479676 RepID=A0AAV6J840_9ERIC|nr:hypothetical protein RHGRI_024114 [Rhododendron griersonianum]
MVATGHSKAQPWPHDQKRRLHWPFEPNYSKENMLRMAEAVMSFTVVKPNIHSSLQATKLDSNPTLIQLRQGSSIGLKNGWHQDPYYDSEQYRKDGGDGTGHWVYEKQEDMEESARAELWREELIEEIEQKVGGLRELEEAGEKEKLVK